MEYRTLGNSNIQVTPVTLGTWAIGGWMWGGTNKKKAIEAIHASIDSGITTLDTAPVYGFGVSEEIVGEAIKDKKEKLQILTKYGLRWDMKKGNFYFSTKDNDGNPKDVYKYAGKESIMQECEQSLKRLGIEIIDLYQIHWPDTSTPVEETMEAVEKLIEQGKIKAAGVCNYDVGLLKKANQVINLASNQVPYSMVNRKIEEEVVPYCIDNNIGILAYSPLQRGLLTGKFQPGHSFKEGDARQSSPYFSDNNIVKTNEFIQKIKPVADNNNITPAQLVINWTMKQPGISSVLVGARNKEQAVENVKGMQVNLTDDEISLINKEISNIHLDV